MKQTRFIASIAFSCLLFLGVAHSKEPQESPRLVLFLSVDQMRYDYLTRFESLFNSGLKTLLKNGAVFSNARFRHAVTETGPGHSVLLSGKHPSTNGIVANEWYDRELKKWINVVEDGDYKPIGDKGRAASPKYFMAQSFGDILKTHYPFAKVVSLSAKDRAAILLGGKHPDAVFWMGKNGRFMTSSYYMDKLPKWLSTWNEHDPISPYKNMDWERILDASIYDEMAGPDDVIGESEEYKRMFPRKVLLGRSRTDQVDSFMRTPFLDEAVIELALKAMQEYQLGKDNVLDLLSISLSATDKIGHNYGPDSHEIMDQLIRLDGYLGRLFAGIDQSIGLSNTLVILSADHGVLPLVETLAQRGLPARRVHPDELMAVVKKALEDSFPGKSDLILPSEPPAFWIDHKKVERLNLGRLEVLEVVENALESSGLFEEVYSQDSVNKETLAYKLFQNSFYANRSPDIIGHPKEYIMINDNEGGTGHGTAHDYDRHVPIIFFGANISTGVYPLASGPEDIVPTLAHLFNLPFEKEEDARILSEMLKPKR